LWYSSKNRERKKKVPNFKGLIQRIYDACVHVYACVFREIRLTVSPRGSPFSADTLSATDMADILRGCVQIMLQNAPRPDSISDSNIYCGS
jgi:hypothetical protein